MFVYDAASFLLKKITYELKFCSANYSSGTDKFYVVKETTVKNFFQRTFNEITASLRFFGYDVVLMKKEAQFYYQNEIKLGASRSLAAKSKM